MNYKVIVRLIYPLIILCISSACTSLKSNRRNSKPPFNFEEAYKTNKLIVKNSVNHKENSTTEIN